MRANPPGSEPINHIEKDIGDIAMPSWTVWFLILSKESTELSTMLNICTSALSR